MASAAITGRKAYLRASTAAASTASTSQTALAELQNYTLTVTQDMIPVTSHDSSGWEENLGGIRKYSWSADVVYVSTGAGQGALRAAFLTTAASGPGLVNVTFMQTTATNSKKYQGKTRLTSFELTHDTNNAVLGKMSGVGSGRLTRVA